MISIKEAIDKIVSNTTCCPTQTIGTVESLNYILSKDVYSPIDMPSFNQSAMDGYALCGDYSSFLVVGEIQAGDTSDYSLKDGEAYRIFTGARIPQGTTVVAKQEIVKKEGNHRIELLEKVEQLSNIRFKGEELSKGKLALGRGTKITPAAVGFLASLGIEQVSVYKKPKITIIVTGDELVKLGTPLIPGKIYESNSVTIQSSLSNLGFEATVIVIKDDYTKTKKRIEDAINSNDMVIITGGISVGDYDFVGKALKEIGVTEIFYKVNQKPGKPLYYGKSDNTDIFALPGNPAAALTCFYIYVLTAIRKKVGDLHPVLESTSAILTHNYEKVGVRGNLLKAQIKNGKVTISRKQSSAMLSSFVRANCLVFLDANIKSLREGDIVSVFLLP